MEGTCKDCLQYYGAYSDGDYLYIASEYGGMDLSKTIDEYSGFFSPTRAHFIQMLEQGKQLAHNGLINTDLKLENMVITEDFLNIKIIDHGLAERAPSGFYHQSGSLHTMAPEVYLRKGYQSPFELEKIHTYSLGMSILLSRSKKLFIKQNWNQYLKNLENEIPNDFLLDMTSDFSEAEKSILRSMIDPNIETRLTLSESIELWSSVQ